MVRNLVILGGNSHPELVNNICNFLGIPPCDRTLSKFEVGESRCEIKETVRGKDVYIIQTAGTQDPADKVNDHFIETCIMVSACKTGSAKRVTAVLPLFPYSRQPDLPYNKAGAPLNKAPSDTSGRYTFESVPATPGPGLPRSDTLSSGIDITKMMAKAALVNGNGNGRTNGDSAQQAADAAKGRNHAESVSSMTGNYTTHDYENPQMINAFQAKPGYKQWVAQAGTLVADLLTCAGADHIITMDLHDPQYQGFFDIPVDNLYGKPLLQRYIERHIPGYRDAVIVSPDAGGAKRATAIADHLGLSFALIHKERRPTRISDRQNATMMLVGDVTNRPCILVDDLADTANTITRAAKLLKKEGAGTVYALLTHGILSGDAIERINASSIDKIIVTNSVPQHAHKAACPKLEVLDVSHVFAEAIRRVHHGESISALFPHD
ncbi:ribose-phosphate diphosphokinase [Diaporthe amygdali]|uniref:ribose-phosphate diphosphokinase n=1 Tax=Phomopsis amygdali TaxID=1214568 RepID=UPI0022FDFD9E|nr:ribose-phosphate diphosphokinase [Diaporthe amygdali]KAJ0125443.1 ribose-phosphate diphosphokinase [Diaporthe amygdali]